jgi:hypothetical protein
MLFAVAVVSPMRAREIVPGVVSFDEPPHFHGVPPFHDSGDNPFDLSNMVIDYQPDQTAPRGLRRSFQQFSIGIGVVGYEIGNGKRVVYRKLGEADLKRELPMRLASRIGQHASVDEVTVSGRKAYRIAFAEAAPGMGAGAELHTEIYYVPFEPNRGVTLYLVADTEDGINALRGLLARISIPADAHVIIPRPPPQPTPEENRRMQIVANLRNIMGAGEQCALRHGRRVFTFAELRQDFGRELGSLKPVDGENYEDLIWDDGKPLRVTTKTLGIVEYPPK